MEQNSILSALPAVLLPWYAQHKRSLPWRADREPYHIWLSEIMLQQTRVEAVKGYYTRFLSALPTVEALANCDDDALHKLWEGLGYYSRVRNLKKAARVITDRYGGRFPTSHTEILALPGIGEYTAGAICSIAYDLPTPAVDGNVLRVCARLLNDPSPIDAPATKKQITARLAEIYPQEAGNFTQALMELGATVCGPNRKPDCAGCPCMRFCLGFRNGTAESLPVKSPKKSRRQEDMTVFILRCNDHYALNEIAIARGAKGHIVDFGFGVSGDHVASLRGDGIIVATATGSTAYALSAGGPLVGPSHRGMIVAPLAPHTLYSRAVVTEHHDVVEVTFEEGSASAREVALFADGDALEFARPISTIEVTAGKRPITLLTRRQESFYKQIARTFYK